jgi:hypothetical protein
LRFGALYRQGVADPLRSASLKEISYDYDRPARAGRRDFVSQCMQSIFAAGNQR